MDTIPRENTVEKGFCIIYIEPGRDDTIKQITNLCSTLQINYECRDIPSTAADLYRPTTPPKYLLIFLIGHSTIQPATGDVHWLDKNNKWIPSLENAMRRTNRPTITIVSQCRGMKKMYSKQGYRDKSIGRENNIRYAHIQCTCQQHTGGTDPFISAITETLINDPSMSIQEMSHTVDRTLYHNHIYLVPTYKATTARITHLH
jgi:hypothetical protein